MESKLKKELQALLKHYGEHPKKSWGQNFLIDDNALSKIVRAAELKPDDIVLEVGAGTGFLTRELASRVSKVISLELERSMAPILENKLSNFDNVDLLFEDGVEYEPGPGPYKLVANIPYQVTARLIRHYLSEVENKPKMMVILIQKEVAQKAICEAPKANLFAMSIAPFANAEIVAKVTRGSFYPVPKVDSAILLLDLFEKSKLQSEEKHYFRLLRICFHNKRKQLINSLSSGLDMDKKKVEEVLENAGISHKRRPETLSLEEWDKLASLEEFILS